MRTYQGKLLFWGFSRAFGRVWRMQVQQLGSSSDRNRHDQGLQTGYFMLDHNLCSISLQRLADASLCILMQLNFLYLGANKIVGNVPESWSRLSVSCYCDSCIYWLMFLAWHSLCKLTNRNAPLITWIWLSGCNGAWHCIYWLLSCSQWSRLSLKLHFDQTPFHVLNIVGAVARIDTEQQSFKGELAWGLEESYQCKPYNHQCFELLIPVHVFRFFKAEQYQLHICVSWTPNTWSTLSYLHDKHELTVHWSPSTSYLWSSGHTAYWQNSTTGGGFC